MRLPPGAGKIMRTLREAGFECYMVGGIVRDRLLVRRGGDADFTTNARPADLQRLFPRSHYENRFGTVLVRAGGRYHEVTTYRGEGRYSDHRHPDEIRFVDSIDEDLQRRDFTINAMALDDRGGIVDPFGGRADLEAGIIRAVGDPGQRLAEDPLRMMRAVRLAVQLGFSIEPRTAAAIRRGAALLSMISRERVRDELLKILESERPVDGIQMLDALGLLADVLPGLAATRDPVHPGGSRYEHALETLGQSPKDSPLRLAALFHVLDEPPAGNPSGGNPDEDVARLRLSNAEAARVRRLIAALPALQPGQPPDARAARRLLSELDDLLPDALRLAEAHARAEPDPQRSASLRSLRDLRRLTERAVREHQPYTLAALALKGDDLSRELGLTPGPQIGRLLRMLLDRVLDDPALNDRATLLAIAREGMEPQSHPSTGSG